MHAEFTAAILLVVEVILFQQLVAPLLDTIVPEKEVLLVLAANDAAPAIFAAVRSAPCLAEPGSGIIFRVAAEDFFPLGAQRP